MTVREYLEAKYKPYVRVPVWCIAVELCLEEQSQDFILIKRLIREDMKKKMVTELHKSKFIEYVVAFL